MTNPLTIPEPGDSVDDGIVIIAAMDGKTILFAVTLKAGTPFPFNVVGVEGSLVVYRSNFPDIWHALADYTAQVGL